MKNINEYNFERLLINHGSDEMLKKIFNKSILEVKSVADSNLKEIYNTINNYYNSASDEEIENITCQLRELEKIDEEKELISDIKELQANNTLIEIDASRFVEMLKYCNIKVPRSCGSLILVRSDKSVKMSTSRKQSFESIFNALDKLFNYKIA